MAKAAKGRAGKSKKIGATGACARQFGDRLRMAANAIEVADFMP